MTFYDICSQQNWENTSQSIYSKTKEDVAAVLHSTTRNLEDFKALISPAADAFLEEMALLSKQITQKRFGKTIQLYLPLYLSNECSNSCIYCGFNRDNKIDRLTLTEEQVLTEIKVIKEMGYQHILLVTGEHQQKTGFAYLEKIMDLIKSYFSLISIEVAPMEQHEYECLAKHGLNTVYIYQETYNRERYQNYHPKGKKSNFQYRLETPDRIGKAGIHKIGLGCLLGLEDWRTDSYFTALHLNYLEKHYWKTKYSVSFPRLRPHAGSFKPEHSITDRQLLQLICAYRICYEEIEMAKRYRQ